MLFRNDPQIKELLKEEKAVTHYGTTVKNQVVRLEKWWKKSKGTLNVTGAGMPHEDAIQVGSNIMDKGHEVRNICPKFYRMNNLSDDRFDDIGAAITNTGEDVDLDVMNTFRKTPKSATSSAPQRQLSSDLGSENENEPEAENDEGIEWEKTDDEDADRDNK